MRKGGHMMKRKLVFFISIVVGIMIVVAPLSSAVAADPKIKVMTRNLYLGADIFKVVEAAPANIPFVVAEVFQTMLETNFEARAEAIADEIADAKPQVIGLQEVSAFYIQTPGDFFIGNPYPAEEVVIDFYTVLNEALEARGMYYEAFPVTNADVELPMIDMDTPPYVFDVRMVDHDYVLVRKGHAASEVLTGNYEAKLEIELGGVPVAFDRGFVVVDVDIKGEPFRFASTHLEVRSSEYSIFRVIQYYQMQELLGTLAYFSSVDPKPIVMVGDLNSSSEDVEGEGYYPECLDEEGLPLPECQGMGIYYMPPYMQATMLAGYLDSWLLQSKYDEGNTSGFDEYVSDPDAELTARIDHIFLNPEYLTVDNVRSEVVGDEVSDMVPNTYPDPIYAGDYLWPSDHAGVVGKIKFLE
jgi:hypothetical protein